MSIRITNFSPIGFDNPTKIINIDDDGHISSTQDDNAQIIDAQGAYLSPGWCDLHVHIWHGGTDISVRASDAGRGKGVTAMADAGSAGEASFHGLREYVIDPAAETIRAFINIGSIGLVACNRVPELIDLRSIDIHRTLKVINDNKDVICGVKVRASGEIVGTWGITPLRIAKRVAEMANLPLMVHVGEPPPLIDEVLPLLSQGDIVTHCFNGKPCGSIADTQALWDMAKNAAQRGVLMDLGHGVASFDFTVAKRAIHEAFYPFSISTDLHLRNLKGPVFDLALTVSKMHALGMPFETCITAITEQPRSVLRLSTREGLKPGIKADFTLFHLTPSNLSVQDSMMQTITLNQLFQPIATVIGHSYQLVSTQTGCTHDDA